MPALTEINVHEFATAVRAELADLPKSEVQALTEGLEADLKERFAEEGEDFNPGSPEAYAAELREAAGAAPKRSKRKYFSASAFNEAFVAWATSTKFGTAIFEFALTLRPVWWVLRAGIAYLFVDLLTEGYLPLWSLPILVLISVQWGRKKWLTNKFFAAILVPLNLLVLVLLIPAGSLVVSRIDEYYTLQNIVGNMPPVNGLRLNGLPITEIKAFDEAGTEVKGLTFEDADGNQLLPSEATPGAIQVPNITGLGISEMQQVLIDAGINNVDFNRIDDGLDTEVKVVATEPSAGNWIDPTSVLTVTVAKHQN